MTVLSVNVNKIAVLRNSRGGSRPDVCAAARVCLAAGAAGITVHPRPDLRHIHPSDCLDLHDLLQAPAWRDRELNIEGNPIAPANARYPGLITLVSQTRPQQATLVPDSDTQLTSDHGWQISVNRNRLKDWIDEIHGLGARVSLFVDDDIAEDELYLAKAIGADRIEIYTGPFADQYADGQLDALHQCARTAAFAHSIGLGVNAGHDLSQKNLHALIKAAPQIAEVSIGHALIDEALYSGLETCVANYLQILAS
jgi:pyridoxine 5-phosphate synthase